MSEPGSLPAHTDPGGPAFPGEKKRPLLLHLCCGPCAVHVIDLLKNEYHLIGLFINPNIQPEEEFARRLRAAARVCRSSGTALWIPDHRPERWQAAVRGHEDAPEGGQRC